METNEILLEVNNLTVEYFSKDSSNIAVKDVSFNLHQGEVLGIVGESGSGKTTVGYSIIGLINRKYTRIKSGQILYKSVDLARLNNHQMRKMRGDEIAFIFQNPSTALNPVYTVGYQIIEAIRAHEKMQYSDAKKKAIKLLEEVGIDSPERKIDQYPHEFSGGMKQRVVIAIAIACNPKLIIADEPTTALDVITQHQILLLLSDLIKTRNLSMLLITHDMGVVAHFCDRMLVMNQGEIVESGLTKDIFNQPKEAYTQKLLSAIPRIYETQEWLLQDIY